MIIDIHNVFYSVARKNILSQISLGVGKAEKWAIIGKNGAGKSTLIKCLARLLKPESGSIILDGHELSHYSAQALAKKIAYVPQATGRFVPAFSVFDYVLMGRYAYTGIFSVPQAEDRSIVNESLLLTDTHDLAGRHMDTLSGGELQRVFLAGAVAQRAEILLLDEPVTFLDPLHQELVRRTLDRVHDEYQTTLITVTHDINTAVSRFDHIAALRNGMVFWAGTTQEFLKKSPAILNDVFDIRFIDAKKAIDHDYFVVDTGELQ